MPTEATTQIQSMATAVTALTTTSSAKSNVCFEVNSETADSQKSPEMERSRNEAQPSNSDTKKNEAEAKVATQA